jgi:serine/threonine protein phosphatase PrpC
MAPDHPRPLVGNRRETSHKVAPPFSLPVTVDVSGLSHPGKVRPNNEDHFLVARIGRYLETVLSSLPPGEVPVRADEAGYAMLLADGMGGHAAGEVASRMAISGLVKLVLEMPDWIFRLDETSAADANLRSQRRMNRINAALIEHGRQNPDLQGMGTTLTAARNLGRHLQIVHVGDSRAYLLRDGCLHRLTRDHTYVQLLIDSGQLSHEEAASFSARHMLVNALGGSSEDVQVDVDQLELVSGDRMILCSDGLTDLVDDDNIRRVLIDCPDAAATCRCLVDLALERGGRDNVTVVAATYTFPSGSG